MLYFLFFLSGVSGLVYQVVWVREFGNVFGNTITSTSLVVAIFMLGLGAGSYAVGTWADRRYASAPESLLRTYGYVELVIAALGLGVSLVLPHLGALSALVSSYEVDAASSWHVVSAGSYVARGAVAIVLLAPITLLMGGTLTLLIRHLVRHDVETGGGWTIALLYAVNTAGAAAGALVTDFFLVPAAGLWATQMVAVALNVVAGAGALYLSRLKPAPTTRLTPVGRALSGSPREPDRVRATSAKSDVRGVAWTAAALALAGFAAMGMEILWLRHFTLLLGGFRAVFAQLITVILLGIAAGSLLGGVLNRRIARPAQALMVIQAAFVAAAFAGLASASMPALLAQAAGIEATLRTLTPWQRTLAELWYNARPMLLEVGLPAVLMGCSFPLGNAVIQHAERAVGTRAGVLYLANTAGAVCGSLVAGFVLLPWLGLQGSATFLLVVAAMAIVPLYLSSPTSRLVGASLVAAASIAAWAALPGDFLLRRSLPPLGQDERVIAVNEGITEVIVVTEAAARGRALITNGHPMSSTAPLDQRYMRALAHVPLLSMPEPRDVLVIGFGVGNSTHAAALHPSVRRVDVADLSPQVLEHAAYFRDANGGVLDDERVAVYVNDGRQHLLMQPEETYDLITLEPPPISHAGVASLYSREFYALARSRLKAGGYLSQWLPAYQVPAGTTLAMVRAFIEVFPQSVLLSGAQAELLLVGTTGPAIEIDPVAVEARLESAPGVRADLARLDLGDVTEIVGTFVSASATLARATQGSPPATDDRPLQEYGVRSAIGSSLMGVPASLFNLGEVAAWCPRCFNGEAPIPALAGLDLYLALLEQAYTAPVADVEATVAASNGRRTILGSAYLGAVVPDSEVVAGLLAARPGSALAEYEAGSLLLERGQYAQAAAHFRAALPGMAGSAELHNNLGVALASMGDVASAREHFREAVRLQPGFVEAQENLAAALRSR
jgi:spermidine synthase